MIDEVGSEKIGAIVTDNASNMKSAWEFVQQKNPHIFCIGCLAHGLHLLCKDLVNKVEWIHDVAEKSGKIVRFFGSHHKPKYELEEQQQRRYGKKIALRLFAQTRWGTIHGMFHSLLASKEALLAVSRSDSGKRCQNYYSR